MVKTEIGVNNTACFTGHRPPKLYGYDMKNPRYEVLKSKIKDIVYNLHKNRNIKKFIFGGAIGLDQIAFEQAYLLKSEGLDIVLEVAVPFEQQDSMWIPESKKLYREQLELADNVVIVDEIEVYNPNNMEIGIYHEDKMENRNKYMVDKSSIVIGVWDGSYGGTRNCIKYANKMFKEIVPLNPKTLPKSLDSIITQRKELEL